jgi:hypothetical protein
MFLGHCLRQSLTGVIIAYTGAGVAEVGCSKFFPHQGHKPMKSALDRGKSNEWDISRPKIKFVIIDGVMRQYHPLQGKKYGGGHQENAYSQVKACFECPTIVPEGCSDAGRDLD